MELEIRVVAACRRLGDLHKSLKELSAGIELFHIMTGIGY